MITTDSISYEREVKSILDELNDELYRQITKTKKEIILKGAKLLEQIGLPKKLIAAELSHGLRGVSERFVRKVLGPEFTRSYDYNNSNQIGTSSDIEEKNDIEEDAKNVRQKYEITDDEEPMAEDRYYQLKEKIQILTDERNWYKEQCQHFKALAEARQQIGDLKISNEVALHPDAYDEMLELMRKSPNGICIMHDGYNVFKFKPLSQKTKPGD